MAHRRKNNPNGNKTNYTIKTHYITFCIVVVKIHWFYYYTNPGGGSN